MFTRTKKFVSTITTDVSVTTMHSKPSYAELRQRLADAKSHLARVEEMLARRSVQFVHVRSYTVREHVRHAHWRATYPRRLNVVRAAA